VYKNEALETNQIDNSRNYATIHVSLHISACAIIFLCQVY